MKKQQKIIALRTEAKRKVAEIETKIAFARSEAAEERSGLMRERANELKGLEAGSTERYDVLAKYRAELADVEWTLAVKLAELKSEIQQTKAECEQSCAAVEDDPEPETDTNTNTDTDAAVKGFQPQQETVYCDGSEHSARIVARRLINKMPHIPTGGSIYVQVVDDTYAVVGHEYFVSVSYGSRQNYETEIFAPRRHTAEFEAAFMEKVHRRFAEETDSGNSHVAEPMARALDAVFGGNPVEQVDNLIADTVKSGKEGENE